MTLKKPLVFEQIDIINANIGVAANLTTIAKKVVDAINEVNAKSGSNGLSGSVNYTTWTYTATSDNTTEFDIVDNGIYEPTKDFIQLFYNNSPLINTENYSITNLHVTLGWSLSTNEEISFIIYKTSPTMDGSSVIDGTIEKQKLATSVQNTITNAEKIGDLTTLGTTEKGSLVGSLNEVHSDLADIVTYNVKQHPSFNTNDISIAINAIASNMQTGDKMVLPKGNYTVANPIILNLPSYTTVELKGNIVVNSNVSTAITYTCYKGKLQIENIKGSSGVGNGTSIANLVGNGLILENTYNCNIDILYLADFENALILQGQGTGIGVNANGTQYNKINFQWICGINAITLYGVCAEDWVTENTFTGGRTTGGTGVLLKNNPSSTIKAYDGNKFYNVGFENIVTKAIDISNGMGNVFVNPRLQESLPSGAWITESTNSLENIYYFGNIFCVDKISNLGNYSKIYGTLIDSNGIPVGSMAEWNYSQNKFYFFGLGNVNRANSIGLYDTSNTTPFNTHAFILHDSNNNSHLIAPIYEKNTVSVDNTNFTMNYLYKNMFILSQTNAITITIPNKFKYDGATFYFCSNWHTNDITFKDESGNTQFVFQNSSGTGTFKAMFFLSWGTFKFCKHSDGYLQC